MISWEDYIHIHVPRCWNRTANECCTSRATHTMVVNAPACTALVPASKPRRHKQKHQHAMPARDSLNKPTTSSATAAMVCSGPRQVSCTGQLTSHVIPHHPLPALPRSAAAGGYPLQLPIHQVGWANTVAAAAATAAASSGVRAQRAVHTWPCMEKQHRGVTCHAASPFGTVARHKQATPVPKSMMLLVEDSHLTSSCCKAHGPLPLHTHIAFGCGFNKPRPTSPGSPSSSTPVLLISSSPGGRVGCPSTCTSSRLVGWTSLQDRHQQSVRKDYHIATAPQCSSGGHTAGSSNHTSHRNKRRP